MLVWNDALSVQNDELDAEHKRLIELINELQTRLGEEPSQEVMEATIDTLFAYAEEHLTHEERLMRESGYPSYIGHKQKHDEFRRAVAGHAEELKGTKDRHSIQQELLFFLQRWLVSHIKKTDREYVPYLSRE